MGFLEDFSGEATTLGLLLAAVVAIASLSNWWKKRNLVPKVELTNPPPALPLTGIHMGIEEFTTLQRRLRDEARTELVAAHGDEKKRLEEKIDALNARLADPDRALAEQQAIITSLEEQLARQGNQLGGDATLQAKAALEAGDFTKARALFETLAAQTEPDVQTHADAAYALGQIAETEIRWHDAAKHYIRAAQLDPRYRTCSKAHEFAHWSGDFTAAELFGIQSIEEARKEGKSQDLAMALNDYSITLTALGKIARAREKMEEAILLDVNDGLVSTKDHATRLSNLAGVVKAQGRYPEAEALYLQALEIDRTTIGTAHPNYATHLNNLAAAVEAQGRYPEAEALYLQALEIDKATIGTAHPEYAIRLNNLAGVVQAQGRYPEARGYYAQALMIFRDKLGDGHPNTGVAAKNLLSLHLSHFPDDPEIPALQALLAAKP